MGPCFATWLWLFAGLGHFCLALYWLPTFHLMGSEIEESPFHSAWVVPAASDDSLIFTAFDSNCSSVLAGFAMEKSAEKFLIRIDDSVEEPDLAGSQPTLGSYIDHRTCFSGAEWSFVIVLAGFLAETAQASSCHGCCVEVCLPLLTVTSSSSQTMA